MEIDRMDIQIEGRAMNYIEQGIKVGDKVWTIQLGEVTVVDIVNSYPYRILVGAMRERYTANGKYWETDVSPSLFWSDPNIVSPPKPEPPKYQWLWKHKTGRAWSLSCGYHADEDELRKYFVLDNRFYVRKFDPQEANL